MSAHVTIDLDDVRRAGGVRQALAAWCDKSDHTSCGVIGPAFATSGPGPGWSIQHDASDFALRAMVEGAMHYLDLDDGRLQSQEQNDEYSEDDEDVHHDIGGGYFRVGDWSDASVVCIECPDEEDALEHPMLVAEMAQAVIDYHHAESDCVAWRKLIESIRNAAEAVEDIDIDDLPE